MLRWLIDPLLLGRSMAYYPYDVREETKSTEFMLSHSYSASGSTMPFVPLDSSCSALF